MPKLYQRNIHEFSMLNCSEITFKYSKLSDGKIKKYCAVFEAT